MIFNAVDLKRAKDFAKAQDPDPYCWGGDGPDCWDCSGFMCGIHRSLRNVDPYNHHEWSTGNIGSNYAQLGWLAGKGDTTDFTIGVIYPWESSSGIGHTAGTIDGLNVESRGGYGVLLGADARGASNPLFRHHFHVKIVTTTTPQGDEIDMATMAELEGLFQKYVGGSGVSSLREDLTVFGTTGLEQTVEAFATRQRQTLAALEALPDKIAAAVVAALPPTLPGGNLDLATVQQAVKDVLNQTGLTVS